MTWADSLRAVKRGGVVVINGVTTGNAAETDLLRIFVEQVAIRGTIMRTLEEMKAMARRNTNWMVAPIEPESLVKGYSKCSWSMT